MTRHFRACAALCVVLLLGACGQSTAAKHEQIVRCTGFSLAITQNADTTGTKEAAGALLTKDGVTEADTIPMGAAATEYGKAMDPAHVTRLSEDGAKAANDLIAKKDSQGIADYTKACVATFKSLGAT